MAAPTVTVDNLRVDDAQNNTGWANWQGGGPAPAAEPSYPYNGTNAINRLSNNTSFEGLAHTPTNDGKSATDHTVADRNVWMCKVQVSDNGDLATADGVNVTCGSSSTNRREWTIAGTDAVPAHLDTYSSIGGEGGAYLIVPIEVDITTYRLSGGDTGTPNFASGDFYGVAAKFQNGNAKSENLAMAAIDFGSGLYVVGGTSPDAPADADDLISHDQGTDANRYGYAYLLGGVVPAVNGRLRIGTDDDSTHTATRFTVPDGQTVYVPQHLASAGWAKWELWIGQSGTEIVIDGRVESLGNSTDIDDRLDVDTITDTTNGTVTGSGTFANCRNVTCSDDWTFSGRIECVDLAQNGATLDGTTFVFESASGVAACDDPDFTKLQNTTTLQGGSGHAYQIAGTSAITLTNMAGLNVADGGWGANTTNDAALYFTATSGTINVTLDGTPGGLDAPTYRSAGVTVNFIENQSTITIADANGVSLQGMEVRIYDLDGVPPGDLGSEIAGTESAPASTYAFTTAAANLVHIQVISDDYVEFNQSYTVPSSSQTFEIELVLDTNS